MSHLKGKDSWNEKFEAGCRSFQCGQFSEAETLFNDALVCIKDAKKQDPRLFSTLVCLGACYRAQERFAEAEKSLRQAIEYRNDDKNFNANDTAFAYKELASCLYEAGKCDEVDVPIQTALKIYEHCTENGKEEVAECLLIFSRTLIMRCQFQQAEPLLEGCLDVFEKGGPEKTFELADTLTCQAIVWKSTTPPPGRATPS